MSGPALFSALRRTLCPYSFQRSGFQVPCRVPFIFAIFSHFSVCTQNFTPALTFPSHGSKICYDRWEFNTGPTGPIPLLPWPPSYGFVPVTIKTYYFVYAFQLSHLPFSPLLSLSPHWNCSWQGPNDFCIFSPVINFLFSLFSSSDLKTRLGLFLPCSIPVSIIGPTKDGFLVSLHLWLLQRTLNNRFLVQDGSSKLHPLSLWALTPIYLLLVHNILFLVHVTQSQNEGSCPNPGPSYSL